MLNASRSTSHVRMARKTSGSAVASSFTLKLMTPIKGGRASNGSIKFEAHPESSDISQPRASTKKELFQPLEPRNRSEALSILKGIAQQKEEAASNSLSEMAFRNERIRSSRSRTFNTNSRDEQ